MTGGVVLSQYLVCVTLSNMASTCVHMFFAPIYWVRGLSPTRVKTVCLRSVACESRGLKMDWFLIQAVIETLWLRKSLQLGETKAGFGLFQQWSWIGIVLPNRPHYPPDWNEFWRHYFVKKSNEIILMNISSAAGENLDGCRDFEAWFFHTGSWEVCS